jgi:PAS domain S-box-containing protein
VITTADLDELLALVHRSISLCLYAENCFVALYDDETKLMRYPFWVDKLDPCPLPRPPGVGFSGYVLRTGKPMLVSPELTEEMYQRGEVEVSGSSSKSWLGVPLKTPTRTIGVLVVQNYEQENIYDERDLEFLSSVGSQIALAIERKRAEQAIQDSEERYHQLVELSPDAIIIHQDEKFAFANTAAVRLAGGDDASDLIGKSIYEMIAPEYHDSIRERVAKVYQGEPAPPAEIKTSRLDGSVVDCEIAAVPFTHRERDAVLAVVRDTSERKRVQLALEEANQRALTDYERLVERIAALGQTLANERDLTKILRALREFTVLSVPCDGLVICLYDSGKETRRGVYCWVDEHEVEPGEVGDIPVGDGMVGRAIKTSTVVIDNNYEQSMLTKQPFIVGIYDDDHSPKSALTAPMTVLGRTIGCVEVQTYQPSAYSPEHATAMRMAASLAASAIENVALAEREHEKGEQLRQAQKMEAVGRLAGGVAHDFNNLLTAINGYSDLTLRSLEPKDPLRPRIEEIKKAGERAASLTRQLLAFSRKQMLQPRVLDLNIIIADVDKMLRRLIGEDVMLETRLNPSLGQVKADPGQIEQILMNLVVNARDALPVGGHITVGTRNRYLERTHIKGEEVVKPGHYVVLSVSDDGCGMDSQTQKKIFEPFFTTKEFGKGTGLGLSTVYGIVKQSEGSIWVYSEPGKGTTFNIYLPRVDDVAAQEEMAEMKQPVAAGRETVLLVEDEPVVRALAREVLEQYGYTVICAADGQEGLDICQTFAGRIDLIITDVVMPRMSGRELAESVASVRPDARILYMSGFTDDAIVRHGMLDEDFPFIQKPFSPELLASKTRELLDA